MNTYPEVKENSENIWNKLLIILIILCSVSFFKIKVIGKADRIFELLGVGLIIFFIVLFSTYGSKNNIIKQNYSFFIILMLIGVLISSLSVNYFYDQSIGTSLYQQRHTYFLLFYFLLPFLNPKPKLVIDLIFYTALVAAIIYILQYFAYPTKLTEAKMFLDRGTLRINLPGFTFIHLGYFLCLDQYFRTSKKKYLYGIFLLFITGLLSGTRTTLAIYVLISSGYLIINKHVKNKLLLFIIIGFIGFAGYIGFKGIIDEMRTSAERETSQGADYIRVRAANYFLSSLNKHKITYLIGKGHPDENSSYGRENKILAKKYGYYLSDVGIIGSYYKFGLLFALSALIILFKVLFKKLKSEYNFIKMFLVMQLIVIFIGYFSFEGGDGAIVYIFILYLTEYKEHIV